MKRVFAVVACLFTAVTVFSQNQQVVDSLTQLMNAAEEDTAKVICMMNLAWHYRDSDPQKFIDLTSRALDQSKKINYRFGLSKAYILLGIMHTIQGDFPKAEEYYLLCKKVKEELGDSLGISSVLNNIGLIHLYQSGFEKALDYFLQSLKIEERLGEKQSIAEVYVNIGNVYMAMKNYDKALEYYSTYEKINRGMGNKYSIPEVYNNMGQVLSMKNDLVKAKKYFEDGITVSRETGNRNMEASCMAGIAALLTVDEKFREAVDLMKRSITMHEELQNQEELTNSLNQLGMIYNKMKNYDDAIGVLYRSISISRKIGLKKNIANAYASIAESYERKNDFENAYRSMYYYSAYTDSVLNEKNTRIVAEMESKFQNEKKEKENALLTQENEKKELALTKKQTQLYLLAGAIALIVFASAYLYNRNKLKQQLTMNEEILKQEKLRLSAIINTQEEERKRISSELHDGLGQMFSAVRINVAALENKLKLNGDSKEKFSGILEMIDDSCKELRNISHNMMPALLVKSGLIPALKELASKASNSDSIMIHVDYDENIQRPSPEIEINIFRIVQELASNIQKYSSATKLNISLNEANNQLTLMLEDNGKAFSKTLLENSKGNGWYNINSRLRMMNGKIELDSKEEKGTVVTIEVPYVKNTSC